MIVLLTDSVFLDCKIIHQAVGNLETSMFGRNFQTKLFPEGKYSSLYWRDHFKILVNLDLKSKISSRFDYFAWSMRWGNVSIESDLQCINPLTHSPEGFYKRAPTPPPPPQKKIPGSFTAFNTNVPVGKIYHMHTKFRQIIPF